MKEGFYYVIKDCFFEKFSANGSVFKDNKNASRPTYCCFEDKIHKGLFWAIPTSSINKQDIKRNKRINKYLNYSENDIRSCFYHIGYTNRKALFCISSAFPIIDKYIERAYTTDGVPLELKRISMKEDIRKKLLKILTYENKFPNKLETHITDIKQILIDELKDELHI